MNEASIINIIAPALVAGLMIALTHAPLGIEVLKRGIIFIDLAVAQIAALGLVLANVVFVDISPSLKQLLIVGCALLAGLFFRRIELKIPQQQEAIIGVCYVVAASLSIVLLANQAHGAESMQHLLSGQILFVSWSDIAYHAPVYGLILSAWFGLSKLRQNGGFYLLFAVAISSSVQLVGVYVVFASLILPALATLGAHRRQAIAWLCGLTAIIGGMLAAAVLDLPAGPVVVLSYVISAMIIFQLRAMINHRSKPT